MKFNTLSHEEKLEFQKELKNYADKIGGKSHFLKMIEDIKEAKNHPLSNKTGKFHFKDGTITWGKEIYDDKIKILKEVIRTTHSNNLLDIDKTKLKKDTLNAVKTLVKLEFIVEFKNQEGFSFKPFLKVEDEYAELNPIFQVIFFDGLDSVKKFFKYK